MQKKHGFNHDYPQSADGVYAIQIQHPGHFELQAFANQRRSEPTREGLEGCCAF